MQKQTPPDPVGVLVDFIVMITAAVVALGWIRGWFGGGGLLADLRSKARRKSKPREPFTSLAEVERSIRQEGLESCSLILAVDFTRSNEFTGEVSFGGHSLHDTSRPDTPNPYQRVISIIGRTLAHFDDDGIIPAFGFGAPPRAPRRSQPPDHYPSTPPLHRPPACVAPAQSAPGAARQGTSRPAQAAASPSSPTGTASGSRRCSSDTRRSPRVFRCPARPTSRRRFARPCAACARPTTPSTSSSSSPTARSGFTSPRDFTPPRRPPPPARRRTSPRRRARQVDRVDETAAAIVAAAEARRPALLSPAAVAFRACCPRTPPPGVHGRVRVLTTDASYPQVPLAIVCVGVGDGPWDLMHEFDDGPPPQ
jgi:hypothetical protein